MKTLYEVPGLPQWRIDPRPIGSERLGGSVEELFRPPDNIPICVPSRISTFIQIAGIAALRCSLTERFMSSRMCIISPDKPTRIHPIPLYLRNSSTSRDFTSATKVQKRKMRHFVLPRQLREAQFFEATENHIFLLGHLTSNGRRGIFTAVLIDTSAGEA